MHAPTPRLFLILCIPYPIQSPIHNLLSRSIRVITRRQNLSILIVKVPPGMMHLRMLRICDSHVLMVISHMLFASVVADGNYTPCSQVVIGVDESLFGCWRVGRAGMEGAAARYICVAEVSTIKMTWLIIGDFDRVLGILFGGGEISQEGHCEED